MKGRDIVAYILQTQGLCKQYENVLRVKDVDMLVPEGAVYGFLGPNGAGKSTTLKMILGLAHPSSGSITVFGQPMTAQNRLAILEDTGSLIESPSYYGHLTGEENLKILQTLRHVPRENIQDVLSIVRLEGHKKKKVAQYSLGMKQRLGLAGALLSHPRLLILDEPTNGLDPAGIQEMRELICDLPRRFGMTIIVSSHLLSEIDQMATHVGIIANGVLVYQDTMERLHQKSEQYLLLRTTNNGAAYTLCIQNGISCRLTEQEVILPPLSDEQVARCVQSMTENQIGVFRIEERRTNLEDIFLSMTKGAGSL